MDNHQVCERADRAFSGLDRMQDILQSAYKLGAPHRADFDKRRGTYTNEGEALNVTNYDSTFQSSLVRLTNALYMGMCPPRGKWYALRPGQYVPEEQELHWIQQLQVAEKALGQVLNSSNFYVAMHPVLLDIAFGTGAFEIHEVRDTWKEAMPRLMFAPIPLDKLGLERDHFGQVGAVFRREVIPAVRFIERFPSKPTIPASLQRIIDKGEGNVEIINAWIPIREEKYKWEQRILWRDGGKKGHALWSSKFKQRRIIVGRWDVWSDEVYGRGPALHSASTAYTLNELTRLRLIACNIDLYGMWTSTDDSINVESLQLAPGLIVPVRSNETANPSLRPMTPGSRLDVAQYNTEEIKSQLQHALYRDALGSVEGPAKTATEVAERQGMVAQDMGATTWRLLRELFYPAITTVVSIMQEWDEFPQVKIDGREVELEFVSPLARASLFAEINGIMSTMEAVALASQINPMAGTKFDTNVALETIAKYHNVPMDMIRSDEEADAIAAQLMQAQMGGQEDAG